MKNLKIRPILFKLRATKFHKIQLGGVGVRVLLCLRREAIGDRDCNSRPATLWNWQNSRKILSHSAVYNTTSMWNDRISN